MHWWPWISREHHEAVCAEKDRHIVSLRAQIAGLEKRLAEPIAVTVKLPDDFAVAMPMVTRRRKSTDPENPEAPQAVVDWANVDENDNEQIAKLAAQELGRPVPAHVLSQFVYRLKSRVRMAKTQKLIQSQEQGTVGAIVPPSTKVTAVEDEEVPNIPENIRQRIADAERV